MEKTTEIARNAIAKLAYGSAMQYAKMNYGVGKPKVWDDDGVDRGAMTKEVLRMEAALTGRDDISSQMAQEEALKDPGDTRLWPTLPGGALAVFRGVVEAALKDQLAWVPPPPPPPEDFRSLAQVIREAIEEAAFSCISMGWVPYRVELPTYLYQELKRGNSAIRVETGSLQDAEAQAHQAKLTSFKYYVNKGAIDIKEVKKQHGGAVCMVARDADDRMQLWVQPLAGDGREPTK